VATIISDVTFSPSLKLEPEVPLSLNIKWSTIYLRQCRPTTEIISLVSCNFKSIDRVKINHTQAVLILFQANIFNVPSIGVMKIED
jgi:hypothetical protein